MNQALTRSFLPRKMRLLRSSEFSRVFKKSHVVSTGEFTLLSRDNSLYFPRIGLIASKKRIRYASQRNRIKRLVKESFRLNRSNLICADFIVIAKSIASVENHLILSLLERLWYVHSLISS